MELSLSNCGEKGLFITRRTQVYHKKRNGINPLKEMEERTYPFPNFDVSGMFDDLLENKIIKLPECKRPEEMGHTNDPKYCKYHRVVSHPVEKCFVLKDITIRLAKEGKILLDLDETVELNYTTFITTSLALI